MSRPLTAVLDSIAAGSHSLQEIADHTGLSRDVVTAAVDHLVRLGRLQASSLAVGCPPAGCGGCASGSGEGTPGCGSGAPSPSRRGRTLVALTLTTRPHP